MSVVEVRQVKNNIKKFKNITANQNYNDNPSMQWGLSHQTTPKAFTVGSDSLLSQHKRIKKDIARRQALAAQKKQMFDIHEAAKKAIQNNKGGNVELA